MLEILHFQQHGLTDPKAPVMVLIHGLFGSGDNLSVLRRNFESTHKVISVDLPDHGLSPWSSKFSFETYAQQVLLTLSSINIDSASIVAHSLGAKVAMWMAYIQPQLIKHLICLDIAPVSYKPRHQNVIAGLTAVNLSAVKTRKDAQSAMAKSIKDAGTQAFLLKSLYQQDNKWAWRFNLSLLVRDYPVLSEWALADKKVYSGKVLFIKGSESDYITQSHQDTIIEQFPQAKAKIVNAGHWLHAEKPQLVNTLITKHLLEA